MTLAVVTGANRGLGLELCRQLKGNVDVVAACRKPSSELKKLEIEVLEGLDVTQSNAAQQLVSRLRGRKIDLLIHNAGILRSESLKDFNPQSIREQIEVNSIAPLVLSVGLIPHMAENSKVAMITSRMGSIGDNDSGGHYGYRMSKAALNMAARSLSIDLKDEKISVYAVHPGFVRTDMTDHKGHLDPDQAAKNILKVIEKLTPQDSGSFWHSNGEPLPW